MTQESFSLIKKLSPPTFAKTEEELFELRDNAPFGSLDEDSGHPGELQRHLDDVLPLRPLNVG